MTHFKRISCRLSISRLVIRNRTDDLHTQKPIHVLNKQLCTAERLVLLVGSSPMLKIFSFQKKNTLICYRTLCNMLNFYGNWIRIDCTSGHGNEPSARKFKLALFFNNFFYSIAFPHITGE